jgi:nitrite reductase/ring-hydroxylating ferredoxin subunit
MAPFPTLPAAWYLFGHSRDLRRGPISKDMLGRRLVAYRTESSRAVVMDARCSHLSADLGCGDVVGQNIRCPYHHWEYAPDGACRHIPGEDRIPPRARQTSYPVEERHGLLFFFHGPQPLFPLPFFPDGQAEEFVAGEPFRFIGDCPWYMVSANAFDGQHFLTVHDRRLKRPPEVDCLTQFSRRIHFHADVVGTSIFDRLLRRFAGSEVQTSITCWGGPLLLGVSSFPRAVSYLLIAVQPLDAYRSMTEVVVFARKPRTPWGRMLIPIGLAVRRIFTRGFMRSDVDRLQGIRYNAAGLLPSDRLLIEFFEWLASLPGGAGGQTDSDVPRASGVKTASGYQP